MFHSINPCMDFRQVFRIHEYLPKEDLELISFWCVSGNSCCHSNALNTMLPETSELIRGTIKPMVLQLHFYLPVAKGRCREIMNCFLIPELDP